MKEKFLGNQYDFIIELEKYGRTNCFHILSLYKKENIKSTITNLNFIISELVCPLLNTSEIESDIFLSQKLGKKLFSESVNAFSNKSWLKELENNLDKDRILGGWNANFQF